MAQQPQIGVRVAYCCLRGAHFGNDTEFATAIQWDVSLLDGYISVEIPNVGTGAEWFLGHCNPGLWRLIRRIDAVFCRTGYLKGLLLDRLPHRSSERLRVPFGTGANSSP
jgi:hypothetical protein